MLEIALKLLKEFTKNSYEAYIVGGFVRDYLLGIDSNDIDITTNATPKEIKRIFNDSCLPNDDYGSVIVMMQGIKFEITTYRKEIQYEYNRKPIEIKYVDDLQTDLLRRDFIMNTICMDENGEIYDYFGGKTDLKKKIIRSIGSPYIKYNEDSLRILRAIRFATILNFNLSDNDLKAISETKYLVKNLSYYRKKNELDKIFNSPNRDMGIKLLLRFGLEKELNIPNLKDILGSSANNAIGVWSMLDVDDVYPFSKNESELIKKIKSAMKEDNLDVQVLYKYGLFVNSCVGSIKGIDIKLITEKYNKLPIKSRNDINIDSTDIMNLLHKEPGEYLKNIYCDLEKSILYGKLDNENDKICNYILDNYE